MYVILDTDELVQRYLGYDSLFAFYKDGVRDVIRDAVLESGKRKFLYFGERGNEAFWTQTLAGRATRAWEEAIDIALDHSAFSVHDYQRGQQKMDREVIQLVTDQIEEDVDRMMQNMVKERYFRVQPPDEAYYENWIGNDLVVEVTQLPKENDGPP